MKKTAILLLFLLSIESVTGQKTKGEIIKKLSGLTLELQSAISPKMYQKAWKEARAGWETQVRDAQTPSALSQLLIQWEGYTKKDKVFSANWKSERNNWMRTGEAVKKWDKYAEQLIEFERFINSSVYAKTWDDRRQGWNKETRQAGQDYASIVKEKNPEIKIDYKAFTSDFIQIFRKSVSGLNSMKVGDGIEKTENGNKVKIWGTSQVLSGAASASIKYDPSIEVSIYIAAYKAGESKMSATKLLAQLKEYVSSAMPDGFVKQDKYAARFLGYKETYYEWNSDKFADVQKRPTVTLGILKTGGNYTVILEIAEPYFKNQYKF